MSHYILRKDLVIDINDEEILYLSLGGCNNDSSGRDDDDWRGEIYKKEDFINKYEMYKHTISDYYLTYRGKSLTQYQYGKHLETMYKRRKRPNNAIIKAWYCDYVLVNGKMFEDFDLADKYMNEVLKSENHCSWNIHRQWIDDLVDILINLRNKKQLAFYVK